MIAQTILSQLGGNGFLAMTGAKNLVSDVRSLTFKVGKAKRGINLVKIALDCDDTYTVDFFKYRNLECDAVAEFSGVYADRLQSLFTEQTGLYTHL